jgi:hypothetical protein
MTLFEASLAQNVENVFHSTFSDRLYSLCVIKGYTFELVNFVDFCYVKKVKSLSLVTP